MGEKVRKAEKIRQKYSISASDRSLRMSEVNDAEEKTTSDHAQDTEKTSIQRGNAIQKTSVLAEGRSEATRVFLASSDVAKLLGITDRGIRDNAVAGKYPGAYKTPVNGIEAWAIPLDALAASAQARYWHEQFTTAGLTADPFSRGTSLNLEEREEHWKRYELATEKCQGRARKAFQAVETFNGLLRHGHKKMDAYAAIKAEFGVSRSTLNEWQEALEGLEQGDWLPALVPDLSGRTNARRADWPGPSWLFFLRDASTPGRPLKTAYKRTEREAEAQGWGKLPSFQTARRDFANLDAAAVAYLREGETALKRLSPTVRRDYTAFALHDQWTMDGRRMDLMVRDSKGEFGPKGRTFRLWLYAVMDMRSRYLVGYAIGANLNADLVRDALMDAFKKTQRIIPKCVQVDNGMEAAAKEITGGAPWRLRGKVKEDEIIGLLPFLGVEVSWATPAHGQTKPIERLFGTLARMCETRPEFKGAYCGNTPEARPEEWDVDKAAAIDQVRFLFAEELGAYQRAPHRGDGMDGKSPMQMYTELMKAPGYAPRQISARQMRVCALSAIPVTLQKDGSFVIHGARYYSVATASLPKGRGYYARYNRHDLAEPVFVYRGSKLVAENVQQIARTPGNSKEAAQKIAKERTNFMRAKKAAAQALLNIQQIETPEEINAAASRKHPGILDKATGEILPVSPVVELTRPAADIPAATQPKTAAQKALEQKQAEDFDALLYPRKKRTLANW